MAARITSPTAAREAEHILLGRRKLRPVMAARRLTEQLRMKGQKVTDFKGRTKEEFGRWLVRTAKKVAHDQLVQAALDVGPTKFGTALPRSVKGWVTILEGALQANDRTVFPELVEHLEASSMSDQQVARIATDFYSGKPTMNRSRALRAIRLRWERLESFRRWLGGRSAA